MSVAACFHLAAFHHLFRVVHADTPALRDVCYRLRHKVYCEEFGFEPMRDNGRESDEWDECSIHCLVQNVVNGEYVACARLVVPQSNHRDVALPLQRFCRGSNMPPTFVDPARGGSVAEVSRLAIVADYRRGPSAPGSRRTSEISPSSQPPVLSGLLLGLLALARQSGIEHTYMLMERRLARYLATFMKFHTTIVGGPVEHHGRRLVGLLNVPQTVENLNTVMQGIFEAIVEGLQTMKPVPQFAPQLALSPGSRAVAALSRPLRFA